MNETRTEFLATAAVARDLIARPEVGAGWDGPSALEKLSVRGLAGHLARAVGSVEAYLDREEPADEPGSAAAYYAAAVDDDDLDSDLHKAIRQRGEETAADGRDALVADIDALLERLRARLADEPSTRKVRVFKDFVLMLDDYLVTRLVELVVHIDDLATSTGVEVPSMPARAQELAIQNMVDVARRRHGDVAIVRALARRERDSIEALRVF